MFVTEGGRGLVESTIGRRQREKIVSGPISRTVLSLAWPVTIGMFMEFALASTDFYWVGKLGTSSQDALTSSMVVIWAMFATISMITVGVTALVSRSIGAEDTDRAIFYIGQGTALALIIGLTVSIIGFILTPALLKVMGATEGTLELAGPYLRICFLAAPFFFLADLGYASFRASGDTRTPTKVAALVIGLNLVLAPLLMFGWGPLPGFGVKGVAVATLIAVCTGMVSLIFRISRGGLGYDIRDRLRIRPIPGEMARIAKIGLPISAQQFVFVVIYWFLISFVHKFGPTAAAAMGIGNRMESFSYLTCYGFSLAASTMVGQNLGAKRPDRAERCAWSAIGLAIGLTSIMTILFLTIPRTIANIFTDDPIVLEVAIDYLIILGLSQVTMAIEIVLEGAFGGAGDTLPPLLVGVPGALLRIPLAYYLAFELDWGINGIWWTLTITTILKSTILAIWFYRGKWKQKVV